VAAFVKRATERQTCGYGVIVTYDVTTKSNMTVSRGGGLQRPIANTPATRNHNQQSYRPCEDVRRRLMMR